MTSTNLDTYFWLIDRLGIEDDSRNKVNKAQNNVSLSKPFTKKIENGHFLSLLMQNMAQTFYSRTRKEIDVQNAYIDPEAKPWESQNWKMLFDLLEDFGVNLTKQKKDIIVKTKDHETVFDIIDALYDIDNNPQAKLSDASKRKLDIKQFKTPLKPRVNSAASANYRDERYSIPAPGTAQILGGKRNSIGQPSPIRMKPLGSDRNSMQTPKTTKKIRGINKSPSLGSLRKSPENQSLSVPKTQLLHDHLEDALPRTLDSARTSVQLVLMSLAMGFDMKPKQAAALLSNNQKFLAIMCIKGQKGVQFQNVQKWYDILLSAVPHLVHLIATEKQDVLSYGSPLTKGIGSQGGQQKENRGKILFKTLNILKNGFYSRDSDVQLMTGQVFSEIINAIHRLNNDMVGDAWDWFVSSSLHSEFKRGAQGGLPFSGKKAKPKADGLVNDSVEQEQERYQFETGFQAIHFAYMTNNNFNDYAVELILQFGKANPVELFTQRMQQVLPKWSFYGQLCLDIFLGSQNQHLSSKIIDQSGVLKYWLNTSIQVADSNNQYDLQDKIIALCFLTEIWLHKSQYVESFMPGASDAIMKILRKASRDMSKNLTYVSIELMFRLLDRFSAEKHTFAPTVYKTLTFLLVEFYVETDVRELMITHFKDIIKDYDTVPLNTLMEPLLRQIETNQYTIGLFNNFDFEFFRFVASHHSLEAPTAMQLLDALIKISMSSVLYQKVSIQIVLTIMHRFGHYNELLEFWRESIKQIMQTLVNIEARKTIHRHHLRNEQNNFFNRLALKNSKKNKHDEAAGRMNDFEYQQVRINEKLIVNLLQQVIQQGGNQLLNQLIKDQLTDSYIAIQQQMNTESKGIYYLLKLFTPKVDQMVDNRMASNPTAAQNVPIPYAEELKQLEFQVGGGYQPGTIDLYKQSSPNKNPMELKRQRSNASMSPVNQQSPMMQGQSSVALPLNTPGQKRQKDIPSHIYEHEKWEEDWEIAQYNNLLKKHNKLFKELHKQYIYDAVKKPSAVDKSTFDQQQVKIEQISSVSLVKLLKDFKLENGLQHQYLKQEVNQLVKFINIHVVKEPDSVLDLSFNGFENFLLQWANQLFGPNLKSFQLMEKLINKMREHENFKKYGLTVKQNETTNRKNVEVLDKLGEKIKQTAQNGSIDEKMIPEGMMLKREAEKVVTHSIHPILAAKMKPSRIIATEVLDEILFDKFGFHFLEPVVTEKVTHKIVPQNIPRQKHHLNNKIIDNGNQFKGVPFNSPLSHGNELSAEQQIAKQNFEKQLKLKYKEQQENKKVEVDRPGIIGAIGDFILGKNKVTVNEDRDNKEAFRIQAINRRAQNSNFTENMQLAVFQATSTDKKIMFECAEVLNELIKAVERGKKNLKLEHVPYRLYQARKNSVQASRSDALSEEIPKKKPLSPQKRKRNQEKIDDFLNKHDEYLASQQQKLMQQKERVKRIEVRQQQNKDAMRSEYEELQAQLKQDHQKKLLSEHVKKLQAQNEQERRDRIREKEIKDNMHDLKMKAKAEIRLKKEEFNLKQREEERHMIQSDRRQERMRENAAEMHQSQHKHYEVGLQKARDQFFRWCKNPYVSVLINEKFKKGLYIKYLQATEISGSTTGLTRDGWLRFLQNHGVHKNVDSKMLLAIHQRTLKEMQEMSQEQYQSIFKGSSKQEAAKPRSGELHYGGFVSAMVKVSNYRQLLLDSKDKKKDLLDDLSEYNLVDKTGNAFRQFLEFINTAEKGKDKTAK